MSTISTNLCHSFATCLPNKMLTFWHSVTRTISKSFERKYVFCALSSKFSRYFKVWYWNTRNRFIPKLYAQTNVVRVSYTGDEMYSGTNFWKYILKFNISRECSRLQHWSLDGLEGHPHVSVRSNMYDINIFFQLQ